LFSAKKYTSNLLNIFFSQQGKKGFFPHINPAIFMQPGGDKFVQLLCHLASHVLSKTTQCSNFISSPVSTQTKSGFAQQCQLNFIKGTLAVEQKKWSQLYCSFGEGYSF